MVREVRRGVSRVTVILLALLMVAGVTLSAPASAAQPLTFQQQPDAARHAADWLRTQQQPDGGFAAFGGASDPGTTADVVQALAAARIDPRAVISSGGVDALTYLKTSSTGTLVPGQLAKVVLALHAANADQPDAAADALSGAFDAATGWYGQSFYGNLLVVLALHVLGQEIPSAATDAILAAQTPEGSWGFNGDPTAGTGDSNTTAVAIQVLAAVADDSGARVAGLNYLTTLQDDNGAIAYDTGTLGQAGGDANSTALAIQAYLAVPKATYNTPGGDLMAALLAFQNPVGAFQFQPAYPDDSLLATLQAIPALMLLPFPIKQMETGSLATAVQPATQIEGCEYFDVTQHNVCSPFSEYWNANGGLANFGYPLSETYDDEGTTVQYFERARFERHPENAGTVYEVLLTRLGADEVQRDDAAQTAPAESQADCAYFDVTGHNVCGTFATFWDTFGGLAVFGYPLTDQFEENGVMVQYFERARLEYQLGIWPDRLDILLGRLGAEAVERELAH